MEAEELLWSAPEAETTAAAIGAESALGQHAQPGGRASRHNEESHMQESADLQQQQQQQHRPPAAAGNDSGNRGPDHPPAVSSDGDANPPAPAAAQQIGQLQAELAAVRQSLATYESTLQMLVSGLGTATQSQLPAAVLQQLQQQQQQVRPAQQQHEAGSDAPATCEHTEDQQQQQHPAEGPTAASPPAGEGVAAADCSRPQGQPSNNPAAEAGARPAPAAAASALMAEGHEHERVEQQGGQQEEPPGRQPSLQQWGQHSEDPRSSQELAVSSDDLAVAMWRQQHDQQQQHQQWQQVPSAPLFPADAAAAAAAAGGGGLGNHQQQAPPPPGPQQLSMQHSAPVPISGGGAAQSAQGVHASGSAQLGSSFGSGLGPFGTSFSVASEDPVILSSAAGSSRVVGGASRSHSRTGAPVSLSPGRQEQQQQSPSPRAADASASAGTGLSDSGGSFDFLRQGLVARRSVPADVQLGPSTTAVGSLQPGLPPVPAGMGALHLHASLDAAVFSSSSSRPGSVGPGASFSGLDTSATAGRDAGLRHSSGAEASSIAAAAVGSSLSQSQHLSSSLGPAGALAAGSGLSLPVLAQGAQLMGLLPPLPGNSAAGGGGVSRQGVLQGLLSPSPGGSLEAPPGGLLSMQQASSSAVSSAPMQQQQLQPLPPPGIIHHLLTDTAGSLDLMSSLSPGTGAAVFGGHGSSAAAAAAAANFTSSFGSEHSIGGSFGMLSGGLPGPLPLGQSRGGAGAGGYEQHDAVPNSRSIDQYSTQQLVALQGLLQQQQSSLSSQDPAGASGSMDPMTVLQQLQAQAMLAAASSPHPSQELLPGTPGFGGTAEQQQMLAAALSQLGIKDPATAAAAAAAAGRAGNPGVPPGMDPAAALAAAAAAAAGGGESASQAQQLAQVQAALASLNLQAHAQVELQALQQAQLVQQLQQHYNAQQLLVAQAAAAAAAATALRQQGASWHGDRRLSNAVASGKLLGGHGSGGSTGSSGGRRSSRGGDALGSGARDSRKASSTGDRPSRASALPDWRRVFVGNIGWWVDEDMLHRVFGEYGTILDAQVMWNTKLLAKGKRVNREFAFISYSSPDEAGAAIRGMHGRYIEGLTKDRDGLTVQYEAQGVGKPASQTQAQPQQQGFVPPVATQQHFLLHQLQQQQQQQQQQGAMQMLLQQQQSDQAGYLQAVGELQQAKQQQQQQQFGDASTSSRFSTTGSTEQRPSGAPL